MAIDEKFFTDSMFDDNCWDCPFCIEHKCTNHKCMTVKSIKATLDDLIYNYFDKEEKDDTLQYVKDLLDYLVCNCLNYTTFEEWKEKFEKYPIIEKR